MWISGLQKLTLLDYPGKIACTIFTPGCDFRCPFCHNASLVRDAGSCPRLPEEEVLSFLSRRKGILQGVCVTGGEPTLQKDLAAFLRRLRGTGLSLKLDTNGSRPGTLRSLVEEGLLDYVAMDVKNDPTRYGETVGIEPFDPSAVLESVDFLLSGAVPYEFRTTVVRELHTAREIEAIARRIRGADRYFLQAFKDSGDLLSGGCSGYDRKGMEDLLKAAKPFVPSAALRGV